MTYTHGGNIWHTNQKTGLAPREIIDFSVNLNPLGPPDAVLQLLKEKINFIGFYPEPQAQTLRLAVARDLGLPAEQVIVGNGASELISLFFWALKPKKVLIPAPAYSDYTRAAHSAGSEVKNIYLYPPDDFAASLKAVSAEVAGQRPDAFVYCNPNNPTGYFWEDISPLFQAATAFKTPLLLDISFLPFVDLDWKGWLEQNNQKFFGEGALNINHFFVYSLTKIFALPGLRLGVGVGPAPLISKMEASKDPWSVNSLAQLAGLQCLQEEDYMQKSREVVRRERDYLYTELKKLPGLRPFPSQTNFLLVNCEQTGKSAAQIAEALVDKGILIRNADNFAGLDSFYLRLAVRNRKENSRLLELLGSVIV
jgi:threonine-phosphate decarboxylase